MRMNSILVTHSLHAYYLTFTIPTAAVLPLGRGVGVVLGEDVVRDGEPDGKPGGLDVLGTKVGFEHNKSTPTPAVPSVDGDKLYFISYP